MERTAERPREEEPERPAVHVPASPLRCPFCHVDVLPEGDDWVACGSCLARHHRACWSEGGSCASCRSDRVLTVTVERPRPAPPPEHSAVADAVLGYLTLGAFPIIAGEQALRKHLRQHDEQTGRLDPLLLALRLGIPGLLCAFGFILFIVAGATLPPEVPGDAPPAPMFALILATQVVSTLPVLAYLNLLRETVCRHEGDLSPEATNAWRVRRVTDLLVTLAGLVPVVGILMIFVASGRVRGALALHAAHECARPRRRVADK